jgi:hypothetical protein
MSTTLFLATVVWALPSFQRLVPSQFARDLSLPGRCSHLSRDKWAFDGRCSGVRRQGRNRVRRAETAVQGHVWSPSDKEIFQGSALNTGQLTHQCQGSRRLPGLRLTLPSSRQCLNTPYAAQPPRRTRRRRHVKPCSGPTNTLFHHGNRIEHPTSASKGIRHPFVGNLKQFGELVQRIFQGRRDLAAYRSLLIETINPLTQSQLQPLGHQREREN